MVRSQKGVPSNNGMNQTKPEHIEASHLISGVPLTVVTSIHTFFEVSEYRPLINCSAVSPL